jgi:hypothetical protein
MWGRSCREGRGDVGKVTGKVAVMWGRLRWYRVGLR